MGRSPVADTKKMNSESSASASHGRVRNLPGTYGFQIAVLANSLQLWMARRLRQEFGVSGVEWRVLAYLTSNGEAAAKDVTDGTLMDKGNVSRAIHRLTKKGLLSRRADRSDRRVARLKVTGKGRRLHDRIAVVSDERQRRLAAALSTDERQVFDQLFAKLSDEAENLLSETEPSA